MVHVSFDTTELRSACRRLRCFSCFCLLLANTTCFTLVTQIDSVTQSTQVMNHSIKSMHIARQADFTLPLPFVLQSWPVFFPTYRCAPFLRSNPANRPTNETTASRISFIEKRANTPATQSTKQTRTFSLASDPRFTDAWRALAVTGPSHGIQYFHQKNTQPHPLALRSLTPYMYEHGAPNRTSVCGSHTSSSWPHLPSSKYWQSMRYYFSLSCVAVVESHSSSAPGTCQLPEDEHSFCVQRSIQHEIGNDGSVSNSLPHIPATTIGPSCHAFDYACLAVGRN